MSETDRPTIRWGSVMLDCDDPGRLADFYARLLGGTVITMPFTDEWVQVEIPGNPMALCCQREKFYRRPVWPATDGSEQQMMAHLDFQVENHEKAVEYALSLGATRPSAQFSPPGWEHPWTTLLDPAGHPFCLTQV